MSDESIEELEDKIHNEEHGLILLQCSAETEVDNADYIRHNKIQQQGCRRDILQYKIKIEELKNKDKEKRRISYGDIKFDLEKKTLEIGSMYGNNKIKNIDNFTTPQSNPGKKTPAAIMLLYCIIAETRNNDFRIKNKFSDYKEHIDSYRVQLLINKNRELPGEFDDYVSGVRALLKFSRSGYEITYKKGNSPRIFQKTNTN